jgi:3-hydroxybutyryl-CoA dehydratase
MVDEYARLLGDDNPLHMNADFAAQTVFRKPIAHGAILFGLISRILGTSLPGPGTVYLSQTLRFRKPAYVGESVTVKVTLTEELPDLEAVLKTEVLRADGEVVAEGEARVKLPKWSRRPTEKTSRQPSHV